MSEGGLQPTFPDPICPRRQRSSLRPYLCYRDRRRSWKCGGSKDQTALAVCEAVGRQNRAPALPAVAQVLRPASVVWGNWRDLSKVPSCCNCDVLRTVLNRCGPRAIFCSAAYPILSQAGAEVLCHFRSARNCRG